MCRDLFGFGGQGGAPRRAGAGDVENEEVLPDLRLLAAVAANFPLAL